MARSVADQFVQTLAAAGVKRVFGIVGDSLNGITDAIRREGTIEWIHVRHEEVAAFAAGANASITALVSGIVGIFGNQFKTALDGSTQTSADDYSQTQSLMKSIYTLAYSSPVLTATTDKKKAYYSYSLDDVRDALQVFQIAMTQACFTTLTVSAATKNGAPSTGNAGASITGNGTGSGTGTGTSAGGNGS